MSNIIDKYTKRWRELREQYKTGYECPYCGMTETIVYNSITFCKTCGVERFPVLALFMGVPVYDPEDAVLLSKEIFENVPM